MKYCTSCATSFSADWPCPACGFGPRLYGGLALFAPELVAGDGRDGDYPYDTLASAEASHFWFRSRALLIAWAIERYFARARSILEVGCGAGGVLLEIRHRRPNARLVGGEVLVRGLTAARGRAPDIEFLQMDARQIPFDREFDVVCAFDVIEHIDEDRDVLAQMYRAAVPGGGVLVTVPQHPWLWSGFDEDGGHKRRYTRRELVDALKAVGLRLIRVTSFTSLMLPMLAVARLRRRRHDAGGDLMIGSTVNQVLRGLAAVERAMILAGISFPAGGSLLAVAERPR